MSDLAAVTTTHSAALEEAHLRNHNPDDLASALQDVMASYVAATEDRLDSNHPEALDG